MSRIYFHAENATAEVSGPERHYAGAVCGRLLMASLGSIDDRPSSPSWLRRYLPADCYILNLKATGSYFESLVHTHLSAGQGDLVVAGKSVSLFVLALNTAYLLGNDAIKLLARLHGQCEIHCYAEGPNRAWLAGIIEQGRKQNILRAGMGWENVVDLLRASDSGPVVTSYSVCEQFPNAGVAVEGGQWVTPLDEDGEPDWETWYDLLDEDKWRLAMNGLRARDRGLELKPDDWQTFYFEHGLTGFDLANRDVGIVQP